MFWQRQGIDDEGFEGHKNFVQNKYRNHRISEHKSTWIAVVKECIHYINFKELGQQLFLENGEKPEYSIERRFSKSDYDQYIKVDPNSNLIICPAILFGECIGVVLVRVSDTWQSGDVRSYLVEWHHSIMMLVRLIAPIPREERWQEILSKRVMHIDKVYRFYADKVKNAVVLTSEVAGELESKMPDRAGRLREAITLLTSFSHGARLFPATKGDLLSDAACERIDAVTEVVSKFKQRCEDWEINFTTKLPTSIMTRIEATAFQSIINILLDNAFRLLNQSDQEVKGVHLKVTQKEDYFTIVVDDNAGGIAPYLDKEKIWEPGISTSEQGFSTSEQGFGLFTIDSIAKSLQGKRKVEDRKIGREVIGARFQIELPLWRT